MMLGLLLGLLSIVVVVHCDQDQDVGRPPLPTGTTLPPTAATNHPTVQPQATFYYKNFTGTTQPVGVYLFWK